MFYYFLALLTNSYSQQKAEFEMYFYFEDAIGDRDTIFFRSDSSIIDDPTKNSDDLNPEWGELIDNSPFDSTLTVRAKSGFNVGGDFYQNIIVQSKDEGNQNGYASPKRLALFIYTKHWPVKMTWDKEYFRNHDRLYGTYATTDGNFTQRYLFNDPHPWKREDIACLASDQKYERILIEQVLSKNWELPYYTQHEVAGQGKLGLCAIMIKFGRPWLSLCDTTTSINDYSLANLNIYPTQVIDEIALENPLNYKLSGEIISLEGKVIQKFKVKENLEYLDLSFLKSGMYFVRLSRENGLAKCFKILKEENR